VFLVSFLICFELSVPVQVITWKDYLQNDLLCVKQDVKLYSLNHCRRSRHRH